MKLDGVINNLVNRTANASWLYKSDRPINKKKYYFECKPLSTPSYEMGGIGYSYFQEKATAQYYYKDSMMVRFDIYRSALYFYFWDSKGEYTEYGTTKLPKLDGSNIFSFGIICKSDKTIFDVYINGELQKSIECSTVFNPKKLYAGTWNTMNNNSQYCQYYFDNDVTYKTIAGKYRNRELYKCPLGGVYGMSNSTFQKLTDDWTALTDDEKIALFEATNGDTPTVADLKTIGQKFKVMVYDKDSTQQTCTVTAVPKDQIILPKKLIDLSGYETVHKISMASTVTSTNGFVKVAFTKDLKNYMVYDTSTAEWVDADISDVTNFTANGMDIDSVANIPEVKVNELGMDGFAAALLLSKTNSTDNCTVSALTLNIDTKAPWDKAVYNTDYTYSYTNTDTLEVRLLKDGSYKINYCPGEADEEDTSDNEETALGWCRKRKITKSAATVFLSWEDPENNSLAQWEKTVIVKKKGSYPINPGDGTKVVVSTVRDEFKTVPYQDAQENPEEWYYRAFPYSTKGNYNNYELNKFGFWHYAVYIDREDPVESTCVHNIEGYDNEDYSPIKVNFTSSADTNTLDWGDWEGAPFMPRPCMLKSDGTVDYYLNSDDYTLKVDGNTSDVANTSYDGNAMMEWSPVFTKCVNTSNRHYIYFCSDKYDDDYECFSCLKADKTYGKHFYMPIYEGTLVSGKLRSICTGGKPSVNTTMTQELTYAQANGTGWNITCWADENLIAMLGILVMGRLNSAKAIGFNCGFSTSSLTHNVGTANKKGMFFGHSTTSAYATKFFGMENWWGHRWRRTAGGITKNYRVYTKMTLSTADGSTVTSYNTDGTGYIDTGITVPSDMSNTFFTDIAGSRYGYAVPTESVKAGDAGAVTGSSSTFYCDCAWSTATTNVAYYGGGVNQSARSGLFALGVAAPYSGSSWVLGASLSYKAF